MGIGAVYEGYWHKDKRHGLGSYRHSNGDVAKGEFVDGVLHGIAEFRFMETGEYYTGEFTCGKMTGMCRLTYHVYYSCCFCKLSAHLIYISEKKITNENDMLIVMGTLLFGYVYLSFIRS